MAYFLKKTHNNKGTYLQIYESFYNPEKGSSCHRSYKPLGYVDKLIESGIEDPIAYYKKEVEELNAKTKNEKEKDRIRLIDESTPEKYLGYFPLKNINDSLNVKKDFNLLQFNKDFEYNVYDLMSSLIYARVTKPCSKYKTFHEVLPKLFTNNEYSLPQIYSCLDFIGNEYEKIIEIYNEALRKFYNFDTTNTYFDCTNFYFEIDKEDDFRRKGPSKENRKDPIVSMGLLLDNNLIPIGMKMFSGNESEKPIIKNVVNSLKERHNITSRVIQVADKGLNCADNIYNARKNKDGYIFSKSIKNLPEVEKVWVLLNNDYKDVLDDEGKLIYRYKSCVDEFTYTIKDESGKSHKIKLKEKRVVTYNPSLAAKKKYEINRQVEKAKSLCNSLAKRSQFGDSSKYVDFKSVDKNGEIGDDICTCINEEKINNDLKLAGYNLLVTSETNLPSSVINDTYHQLWRIEESFKVMKSDLDARPVYLQKENTITGHFLICYLSVLLLRLFQFKILNNKFHTEAIINFIKEFRVIKVPSNKYINLSHKTKLNTYLSDTELLHINHYFLNNTEIKMMLDHRFKS